MKDELDLFELNVQDLGRMIAEPPKFADLIAERETNDDHSYKLWVHTPMGFRGVRRVFVEFDDTLIDAEEDEPKQS